MGEMMEDVTKSKYAEFLESLCRGVLEYKPKKIAVIALMEDGTAMTCTYGDCGPYDLMTMAGHIQADAMFEIMKVNAKEILEAAEEEPDDE